MFKNESLLSHTQWSNQIALSTYRIFHAEHRQREGTTSPCPKFLHLNDVEKTKTFILYAFEAWENRKNLKDFFYSVLILLRKGNKEMIILSLTHLFKKCASTN